MNRRRLRHALEYASFRAVRAPITWCPHAWARILGRGLGWSAYYVLKERRRITLANLAAALPDIDAATRARIAQSCFAHFGATCCEVVSAARYGAEHMDTYFNIEGEEHLHRAIAAQRGVFLMTGHLGAWELAAYPLGLRLERLDIVARPPDNPWIAAELARCRERINNRLIPKRGAVPRVLQAIRDHSAVAMVIDSRAGNSGMRLPFLGRSAWFHSVMATIAVRRRIPILPVFCRPQGNAGYRLIIRPPIEADGTDEAAEQALMQRCLNIIEEEIRRTPGQWLWMHDLWRA